MRKHQLHLPDYLNHALFFEWRRIEVALMRNQLRTLKQGVPEMDAVKYDHESRQKRRIELREEDYQALKKMAHRENLTLNACLRWLAQDMFDNPANYHVTQEELTQ